MSELRETDTQRVQLGRNYITGFRSPSRDRDNIEVTSNGKSTQSNCFNVLEGFQEDGSNL